MPESWPDLAGRLEGAGHVLPVRIYFEDTDFSGLVYHGAYVRFLERARSDFVRLRGVGHDGLARGEHGEGLAFTVRRMKLDFRKPARIDDVIEVRTYASALLGARIVLEQRVERHGDALVIAEVELALINRSGQARRLPESVRRLLDPEGRS